MVYEGGSGGESASGVVVVVDADVGGDGALVRMPMTQCTMQNIIIAQKYSGKLVESRGEMKADVMPIWP